MAEEQITVVGKIVAVTASNRVHKVVRDPEGEKRVREDLKASLRAESGEDKIAASEFNSRYRAKLEAYSKYAYGAYIKEGADGKPALMVPKPFFENEVKVKYEVEGKSYTSTVTCVTEKKCMEPKQPFYLTVDKKNPKKIIKSAKDDFREKPKPPANTGETGAGAFMMLMILAFMLMLMCMGK